MPAVRRSLLTAQGALKPRYFWSALVATYVVSRLGTWGYPYDSDHWIFYYVGANWFHGGSLYVTAWDHKPPVVFFVNGLMSIVFGGNIVLHRLVFTLFSLLDTYLFYRLCSMLAPRLANERRALGWNPTLFTQVAVVSYVFWRDLSQFTSSANNTENLGLLLVLGLLLSFVSYRA